METVGVSLGEKSYTIHIQHGILADLAAYAGKADQWFILTDENVNRLYGEAIDRAMGELPHKKLVLPAGEGIKTFQTAETIIEKMLTAKLTRRSMIIAFGGGVIGDIAGFCASIYMRGIRFLQIPTTLLAQIDSSVGGKTGINLKRGKNMAGTFYQPEAVLIDTALLASLPSREFTAGMGEAIKYGCIYDYPLMQYMRQQAAAFCSLDTDAIYALIKRCCQIKAEIVNQDEKEQGQRKILNFGHTVGHAIETLTDYKKYLHGEAVLIGMYYESLIAQAMGHISEAYCREIITLITETGGPMNGCQLALNRVVDQMSTDKKNHDGLISLILPVGKGKVSEFLLPAEQIRDLLCKSEERWTVQLMA